MLTPFTDATCPKCGHTGKPDVKEPKPGILELIPHVGLGASGYRLSKATLHCAQCGEPLTESIAEKASSAAKTMPGKLAAMATAAVQKLSNLPPCPACGCKVAAGVKFCGECGARLPD